jgi:chromosome segregation ATPase
MTMRTLPILFAVVALLASCGTREKELEQQLTELQQLSAQKDADIDEFITSLSTIQSNLDSIKQLEGIVTARALSSESKTPDAEQAILEDMMLIYDNMKRTRSQIETLEKQLEQSSIGSEKLKAMIAQLKKDIQAKDEEIATLKQGLAEANIYIDKLMTNVDQLAMENERRVQVIQQKNQELQQKEVELHTAFWVVGKTKDLRDRKIIDKEGAFLGMGGVKVVSEEMNLSDLTEINYLEVKEIAINGKKPELVTPHPKLSYEFVGDSKSTEKLVINDPEAFWQNSKVLVIAIN